MNSQHVLERIRERIDDDNLARVIFERALSSAARLQSGSHAVYVHRSRSFIGDNLSDYHDRTVSNGTLGVAIVRDGNIVTFMWRRDNQPATPDALRVDRVWHVKGV